MGLVFRSSRLRGGDGAGRDEPRLVVEGPMGPLGMDDAQPDAAQATEGFGVSLALSPFGVVVIRTGPRGTGEAAEPERVHEFPEGFVAGAAEHHDPGLAGLARDWRHSGEGGYVAWRGETLAT